jgi:hypothetical protein
MAMAVVRGRPWHGSDRFSASRGLPKSTIATVQHH